MTNVSLNISLADKVRDIDDDLLFLEQEDYSPYIGKLTKEVMAWAVIGWIYPELGYETENSCGGEEGVFETTVFAYLYQQDLNYTADLSYGMFTGARTIETLEYVEVIRCQFKEDVEFSYPCEALLDSQWVGGTYDNLGNLVPKPTYTNDNRTISFSDKVWGSLRVRYTVTRHVYKCRIESREKDDESVTENKYSSTAYAVWNGGIDFIGVDAPYGFENTDGECGNGDITDIDPDPDPERDPPKVDPVNTQTRIDYCSQEEI